jgi:importin-5
MLLTCGMQSSTLTPEMVYATFRQLVTCIGTENDASFVASLYKCFADCAKIVGGPSAVPDDAKTALVEVSKRQLQVLAEKRKRRGGKTALEIEDEREDLALFEELEGFALDDMEKTLQYLDPSHPLLVAVSGVRQLGLGLNQWEDEDA